MYAKTSGKQIDPQTNRKGGKEQKPSWSFKRQQNNEHQENKRVNIAHIVDMVEHKNLQQEKQKKTGDI